jgi:hypothetical protein
MTVRRRGICVQKRTPLEIERLAWSVRQRFIPEVGPCERVPAQHFMEFCLRKMQVTVKGKEYRIDYDILELAGSHEAETTFSADTGRIEIRLPPRAYEGLSKDYARDRFTFFHELGHVYLHGAELLDRRRIRHAQEALQRGEVLTHTAFRDTEVQANSFSAAFQAPSLGLLQMERAQGALSESLIQRTFGLSAESARYRLKNFTDDRSALAELWPEEALRGGRG